MVRFGWGYGREARNRVPKTRFVESQGFVLGASEISWQPVFFELSAV